MAGHPDAFHLRAENRGCDLCGVPTGSSFYVVEYSIFPVRLVRKRHRELERVALYCRNCYELGKLLAVKIDGRAYGIEKGGTLPSRPDQECVVCGANFSSYPMYGIVTSMLMVFGSIIESLPLATLCGPCAERCRLGLPHGDRGV